MDGNVKLVVHVGCLLIVSELLISWSRCLKSLGSDSKSSLDHLWKEANHKQMTYHGAFCDSIMWSCCFSNRLLQNECAIAFSRVGGHDVWRHEQKENSEQSLALFYIPIHQQILKIIAALPGTHCQQRECVS